MPTRKRSRTLGHRTETKTATLTAAGTEIVIAGEQAGTQDQTRTALPTIIQIEELKATTTAIEEGDTVGEAVEETGEATINKTSDNGLSLKPDLDAAVEDPALGMGVKFGKRWVLMRRYDHRSVFSLANIGEVLGIDKHAVSSKGLFAK